MKITFVELLTLILLCLTGIAGALSTPEINILPQGYLKYIPLALIVVLALKNAIYLYLDWADDGHLNKSYKPPAYLPMMLAGLCLLLVGCAGVDWQGMARRAAMTAAELSLARARAEVIEETAQPYPDQGKLLALQFLILETEREIAEAKGQPVPHDVLPRLPEGTGAKTAVLVTP